MCYHTPLAATRRLGRTALKHLLFALLLTGFATTCVAARVGVSYTSVSPLPDPERVHCCTRLRAIGGLFSAALSVASRRLAVSQRLVLRSPDFPLRSQHSDRLLSTRVPSGGLEPPRPFEHQILSLACLPIPPQRRYVLRFPLFTLDSSVCLRP